MQRGAGSQESGDPLKKPFKVNPFIDPLKEPYGGRGGGGGGGVEHIVYSLCRLAGMDRTNEECIRRLQDL